MRGGVGENRGRSMENGRWMICDGVYVHGCNGGKIRSEGVFAVYMVGGCVCGAVGCGH